MADNFSHALARGKARLLLLLIVLTLTACSYPSTDTTPAAPSLDLNPTQAHQTVIARVTEMAALTPTPDAPIEGTLTPVPDGAPQPTATTPSTVPQVTHLPTATSTATLPATPTPLATPTPVPCDLAAAGAPIDVTIPDDTEMVPGQTFTKIWRLYNAGSCTWTAEYDAVWFSGDRMAAAESIALSGNVAPGQSVDIAVDMTAPDAAGSYQGDWKLRNASGVLFSIGADGNSPFWVRIVVVEAALSPTPDLTITPTPSITPTPVPTSPPHVSGPITLALDNHLDLDSLAIVPEGGDLLYQADEDNHVLTPQGGAQIGVFGSQQPAFEDCQAASMSAASLPIESLSTGTYLCYLTTDSRYGRLLIDSFDTDTFALGLEVRTWANP